MAMMGIDIGGSGIKGALVDVERGELVSERIRIETPRPATPGAVAAVVAEIVRRHGHTGPVGVAFPAVVRAGVVHTAANIDPSWIGVDAARLFSDAAGVPMAVLNDADAAGIAEMRFGAGRDVEEGVVIVLTFGTGIGSGVFVDRHLHPNTELGHLEFRGMDAERYAAARVRKEEGLSWEAWAERVDAYLRHVAFLFWPDRFVLGGGVSKRWDRWGPLLTVDADTVPAELRNEAGIVGAAMVAAGARVGGIARVLGQAW